ncbi:MAG: hypothetical protein IKW03_04130 [Clostridia bacterium]|nr:hypothetical protein [Clostridia bacterium]
MKRIITILISLITIITTFVFPVSAKNNIAEMTVKSTPNWIYDYELADKYVFPDYFTTGRTCSITFSLNGIKTLDLCEFDILYNSDVFEFVEVDMYVVDVPDIIGAVRDETPVATAEKQTDGKVHVSVKGNKNIKSQYFYVSLAFKIKAKGNSDLAVKNIILTDCTGNSYDVNVNTDRVPVKSFATHEIPKVKLDFEKTLSYHYGSSNYITTVLSRPMTVSEAVSIAQVTDDKCEKVIVNDAGERLSDEDMVPTGARFVVLYDGVSIFTTNIVLIGDVNGDALITAADARKVLRYAAKLDTKSMDVAEVDAANTAKNNSEITSADAREILRYSAGLGQSYKDWYDYHCIIRKYYPWLINDNIG